MPNGTAQAAQKVARPMTTAYALPPINPFLGLLPKETWNRQKDYFSYSAEFLPLSANATQQVDVNIQSDADFLVMVGVRQVTNTANTTFFTTAPFLIQLLDSGSGRLFSDKFVHIENIVPQATQPFYWPFPKLIYAGAVLSTRLQNLDATNAYNVRITYHGFKIFPY